MHLLLVKQCWLLLRCHLHICISNICWTKRFSSRAKHGGKHLPVYVSGWEAAMPSLSGYMIWIPKPSRCSRHISLVGSHRHFWTFSHFRSLLLEKHCCHSFKKQLTAITFLLQIPFCSSQGQVDELSLPRLIFLGKILPSLVTIVRHLGCGPLHNLLEFLF